MMYTVYTTNKSKDDELICQSEDTSVSVIEGCLEINTAYKFMQKK